VRRIAVADVGGTRARFALASIEGTRVASLGEPVTLKTADYTSFELAWQEFGRRASIDLPRELSIAFAGPIARELISLTNSSWVIQPDMIAERLGLVRWTIVNDFGAVAYAVATLGDECFGYICGPQEPLPETGVVSIIGPGTGLGVAALLRTSVSYEVIETEGGHVDFAPLDSIEDQLLARLRSDHGRVSIERIVSGPGLMNLYQALGALEGGAVEIEREPDLWAAALAGTDRLARVALDRFCLTLGSVAGDMALAQGAAAVVIGGGIGARLAEYLPGSGFRDRFVAKGRFEPRMNGLPVKLISYPEPGLFGAAAAFAKEHA
jgi:glucokinase